MNQRLSLDAIRARLLEQLNDETIVGTSLDRNYISSFGKQYPAAWVGAQRLTPMDSGTGYSGCYRQPHKPSRRQHAHRAAEALSDVEDESHCCS